MDFHIKLTIQEIVDDFEKLLRLDEELNVKLGFKECDEKDINRFHEEAVEIASKYISQSYAILLMKKLNKTMQKLKIEDENHNEAYLRE